MKVKEEESLKVLVQVSMVHFGHFNKVNPMITSQQSGQKSLKNGTRLMELKELSAYDQISVAVVISRALLCLSLQVSQQREAKYAQGLGTKVYLLLRLILYLIY
ncbi:UNKNOWN [Stylonychia lemnae]|uniref:Uncharacterized protein n=1 Tax=Stylonychia lemnae TaxID=5949 RepID=A0A077ZN53_STYLE|nr:UNKNOWN [Stylonychia lemnae]|eukprot:CDW71348.1 UNKNOWN [Stylonychia lemnae]